MFGNRNKKVNYGTQDLGDIKPGDIVEVRTTSGSTYSFVLSRASKLDMCGFMTHVSIMTDSETLQKVTYQFGKYVVYPEIKIGEGVNIRRAEVNVLGGGESSAVTEIKLNGYVVATS